MGSNYTYICENFFPAELPRFIEPSEQLLSGKSIHLFKPACPAIINNNIFTSARPCPARLASTMPNFYYQYFGAPAASHFVQICYPPLCSIFNIIISLLL